MSIVLSLQFTPVRLAHLHNRIMVRHIGKSSSSLYYSILDDNSQAIDQYVSIQHHTNPNQSYHKVYLNVTSSLNTSNYN